MADFPPSSKGEVAGTDFFTSEVWTARGLVTYYVLFVIDLETRRVHFAGATPNPDGSFMAQVARNLTDTVEVFLASHRFLICDRDAKYTAQFQLLLQEASVKLIRTPLQAPQLQLGSRAMDRWLSARIARPRRRA